MDRRPGVSQALQEPGREPGGAVTVRRYLHANALFGRVHERLQQLDPDGVLEPQEGFQHHFLPRVADGLEYPREELLPVLEQLELVPPGPATHRTVHESARLQMLKAVILLYRGDHGSDMQETCVKLR